MGKFEGLNMDYIIPIISIVIPIYNEEDNVDILYQEIRGSVDQLQKPYEIIFIDDRSSDASFERLKIIKEREQNEEKHFAQTRIIRFARNFGQTAAMQAGFDQARGNVIVSLDGDLQNDPNDIPKLLSKLDEGYDVVCGWRKDRQDKKVTRIIPSRVANWLIAKVTGVPIHDNGCSLKAYRSSVIKSVRLYSDMHRFIPAVTTLVGSRIAEIVVNHRPRKYGTTKYGLSRVWKVLFDMITIKMLIHFHNRPFLWFAIIGFVFGIIGLGLGITSVFLFLQGVQSIVYPATSFLLLSLFGSLLSWGLLAEFFVKMEKS
jgi:glycosyltransferase involved in cell wall biosynthesis